MDHDNPSTEKQLSLVVWMEVWVEATNRMSGGGISRGEITNEPTLLIRRAGRRLRNDSGLLVHLSNFQGSAFLCIIALLRCRNES